jgi:hypothetical protein
MSTVLEIQYDFDIDGALQADPFLDSYQISLMFEQTRQSIESSLQRKLAGIICEEHGEAPKILISGRYNAESEEFDVQYNIDTCCKLFLVRVVKTLNNVG